jgi:Na+-transporting NADH:ubiquinone oxidoreductase subunit NqrE
MSARAASWLAWSLCGLSLVLTALSLFLFALNLSYSGTHGYDYWLQNAVQAGSFSIIGTIIASRLPANPVGWLFCAAACTIAVECLSAEYAIYTLVARPDSLPAGEALAWLAFWAWIPSIGCIVLSLLLFPNGRLPSSGWSWLAWLSVLLTIAGAVWVALSPGAIGNLGSIHNPLGIEGLPRGYKPVQTIMSALLLVAAVSTLGLRLLRTRGIEHQQIKWPAFVAVMAAVGSILYDTAISEAIGLRWLEWAGYVVVVAALVSFPISIGIAIVRYRLYDIDRIINRTLVYGALTVVLVAVYFGGIVVMQRTFVALTGQKSTLAVVASTLLIAALFTPLRKRTQRFIDRSFYRSKYDAAKTLEGFSMKLRDETDLEALSEDLVGVVRETMQPAHVSLWLRPDPPPRASEGRGQVS